MSAPVAVVAGDVRAPGWNVTDCLDLVEVLLRDLARARNTTPALLARHYCLPPRPPLYRPSMEAPR